MSREELSRTGGAVQVGLPTMYKPGVVAQASNSRLWDAEGKVCKVICASLLPSRPIKDSKLPLKRRKEGEARQDQSGTELCDLYSIK